MSEQQQLWNSFLSRWPREKLNGLTLEEYVSVNDDDTFTYWLETKTRELGSIQGNTSAKFGIYKRGSEGREQNGIGHGEVYTWRTRYGDNELEVFNYVKKIIIQIAQAAYDGDLNTIDSIDFAPLVKWKIAFLYQNQQVPALINTFSKPMLLVLTDSNNKTPYPKMYKQLIDSMGGVNLLEYGEQCWKEAESKKKEIERQTILEQFSHIGAFQSGLELWPQATTNAFSDLISEANKQKLDIFVTDMDSGGMIRIGRKDVTDFRAKAVFATFEPTLSKIKFEQRYLHKNSYECLDVDNQLLLSLRESKNLRAFTKEFPISRKSHWPEDYEYTDLKDGEIKRNNTKIEEDNEAYNMSVPSATNQILYGPPGTGKTYHTIEAAVKAAEPEFIWNNRDELKAEYERLVSDKRIRFVTFHQSYGYEEFVEGLRAETDEENNIHYSIKDGVFKAISNKAAAQHVATPSLVNDDSRIWQLSIESSGKSEIKNHCLECDIGAIGWGHVGDMTPSNRTKESDETLAEESYPNQSTIRSLCNEMSVGDIVFCVSGQWTIEAIGVVTGDYEFRPGGVMHREDYCHTRPIKWLAKGLELNVFDLNCQTRLPIKTCSELTRFSLSELLAFLGENNVKLVDDIAPKNENHVLVIDEINRGNISKIFGELITLIEPSKRAGEDESLELTLPYSGKPFSVPNNLHIVGTMNTADRSLAMMDTALRRRFDFVEMMPKPDLLEGKVVKCDEVTIDLEQLLTVLNQRIEVLYDREHTLGHAFLMPVKALVENDDHDGAFNALVSVFQNKIIPLLEEYFFEDWDKIRLVLADNQKVPEYQFVTEKSLKQNDLTKLFGSKHTLTKFGETYQQFLLKDKNDGVWINARAYTEIYSPDRVKKADESDSSRAISGEAEPQKETEGSEA